jgi:hypothetical protein
MPSEREVNAFEDPGLASQPSCNVESLKYGSSIPEAKAPAVEDHKMFCAQNLDEQGGRFVGGQRFAANNLPSVAPSPVSYKSVLGNEHIDTKDLNDAMVRMTMGTRPALPSVPLNDKGRGHGISKEPTEPTLISRGRGMPATSISSDPGNITVGQTMMSRGRGIYRARQRPAMPLAPIGTEPTQTSRGRGINQDKVVHQ